MNFKILRVHIYCNQLILMDFGKSLMTSTRRATLSVEKGFEHLSFPPSVSDKKPDGPDWLTSKIVVLIHYIRSEGYCSSLRFKILPLYRQYR